MDKAVVLKASLLVMLGVFGLTSKGLAQASYQMEQRSGGRTEANNYYAPLTEREKGDIRYIILTISGKSKFSLLFAQSSLNQAGNRVSNVHPLVFLGYVFSDPELSRAAKNIDGMVWDRFSGDMAKSLKVQADRGNVKREHLDDFAKKIGVQESTFDIAAKNGRWKELITLAKNNSR